jgi:virginiamycin B lyase
MNRNIGSVYGAFVAGALVLFGSPAQATVGKTVNTITIPNANANSTGIVVDTNNAGTVYFTDNNNAAVGISTANGSTVKEYNTPTFFSGPQGIVKGSDGAFWFCEDNVGQVGRIDSTGKITEYVVGASDSTPFMAALGSDGNVWFTEVGANAVASITTKGVVTTYGLITGGAVPIGIVAAPDKNLYVAESFVDQIAQVTTAGVVTEFAVTAGSGPNGITIGSDGNIWYTELFNNAIGKMDIKTHAVTDYPLPTGGANPQLLTLGADGNVWFTEADVDQVGRITSKGKITEYKLASGSGPTGIASAARTENKNNQTYVYVSETALNQIARVYTGTPSN